MDGSGKVGGDLPINLRVRKLFRSTEQAIACVADNHVYPTVPLECAPDGRCNAFRFNQIEPDDIQAFAVVLRQLRQRIGPAGCRDHLVSLGEQLPCHIEAEPRGSASNEPSLGHVNSSSVHLRM